MTKEDSMTDTTFSAPEFANPSAAWRGKPFWSWNGKLEQDELIRQIHVLKEMGMGGYFMHSRTGLVTEYLGEEWFALTNACAEEGERLGMESWLYDEDRWPSGTAGGMVTANPDFQMKFIRLEKVTGASFDLPAWERKQDRPLGAWSCRLEDEADIFDVEPVTESTSADELAGKTVLAFSVVPMAEGSFYNGNTYVDTMKREATEEYIRLTHEAYKRHSGQYFGNAIKGIFTDEPHRGPFMSGFGSVGTNGQDLTCLVPWTDAIFDAFADAHGARVEAHLPELFLRLDGAKDSRIKAQYADTMLSLFLENFARPYYAWCDANDLLVTGHVLHENSLSCQVSTNGSVQRYYPLMHVPGIDYLGEHGRDYWVAKQVDSTARQFEQTWILSELYGCTGWQMNFESHKAVGAWQALFGVNLRCHHLSWYTMGGEAKRDYPASILHQSPWYKAYDTVESWFARLGYFRSQGEPCCDLLVLNPVESVWGKVYPRAIDGMAARDEGIKALEKHYAELFHILAGNQIDFDYGDEALLAEHGSVDGEGGEPTLTLGAMTYTTVLVSGAETIRSTTLELLKQFVEAGGRVIFAGDAPALVDTVPSQAAAELADSAERCVFDETAIVDALDGHTPERVRITDAATGEVARDVFCQLRRGGDGYFLTVLNMDRDEVREVRIELIGLASVAEPTPNPSEEGNLDEKIPSWEGNLDEKISSWEGNSDEKIPSWEGQGWVLQSSGFAVEEWDLESGVPMQIEPSSGEDLGFATTLQTSQARCFRMIGQTHASSLREAQGGPRRPDAVEPVEVSDLETTEPDGPNCHTPDASQAQRRPEAGVHLSEPDTGSTIRLDQPTSYTLADKNICVLDLPAWSLDGGEEQSVNDILQIDRQVRQQLGVPLRGGDMVQPWFRGKEAFPALGQLTLRYPITVEPGGLDALNGMQLVMEAPGRFEVSVNGTTVDTSCDSGWWVDVAFRRITLPDGLFREGENEITVSCDFSEDLNLEAVYLLGDFAVSLAGTTPCLDAMPERLAPSCITQQGFPFYSDSITYHFSVPEELVGKSAQVSVPGYEGAYLKLGSGDDTVMVPWRPNEACLALDETLDVEICITRKNTFGPLHLSDPRPGATGPHSFVPGSGQFSLEPVFIESGLLAPVELQPAKEKI